MCITYVKKNAFLFKTEINQRAFCIIILAIYSIVHSTWVRLTLTPQSHKHLFNMKLMIAGSVDTHCYYSSNQETERGGLFQI